MIGARPPRNQFARVRRTVIETHSRERAGQDRIGSDGSAVFQLVDDDFGRVFTRGLFDDGLDGLADQLVVVESGPDHKAARFRVHRDAGLGSHAHQETAQCGGIGRAHRIDNQLGLMLFVRTGAQFFQCRSYLFVFCRFGPGNDRPRRRIAKKLDAWQQLLQHLECRRRIGFAHRMDLHHAVHLFELLFGELGQHLSDQRVILRLGPGDQLVGIRAGREGHFGNDGRQQLLRRRGGQAADLVDLQFQPRA